MAPGDPRCPHCDGPISETSSYCMHCGGDVESAERGVEDGADRSDADEFGRVTAYEPPLNATDEGGWLDPDGFLDDVSTVAVAGVAAVLAGLASLVVVLLGTQSLGAFLVAPVVAAAVALWVGRNRSVFGAARKACYAIAASLVLVPLVALGPSMKGGTFDGQVLLFLLAEIPFGGAGLLLVGLGYVVGKRRPESARD